MQNVIVGTSGHGSWKTCLIKALTGIQTDRLREEQKKGGSPLSWDSPTFPMTRGFTSASSTCRATKNLLKNMLAGIGGIDLVLLVIALMRVSCPRPWSTLKS